MIPILLSLVFGAGVYLAYDGLTRPAPTADDAARAAAHGAVAARALGRLRATEALQEFLLRAGLQGVTPRDFVGFATGTGLACAVLAQLLLGWVVVSLLAGLLGTGLPLAYYVHRHDRRRAAVQGALADAIAQLRDSIRAGLSVQEALIGLAQHGPAALRADFATLARDSRLLGFEAAMARMRERLADPVFDVVAVSLTLNDALGGRNVGAVLDRLAHATRVQLRMQQEIRAYQVRNVWAARIVAAVPVVVLVAVRGVNPRYLAVFDGWWGQLLLAGCGASIALGYAAMLWLTRLPGERRVLGPAGHAGSAGSAGYVGQGVVV